MDTNQSVEQTIQQPVPTPGLFGTKIPSVAAFVVGILLFFMPFIDIKCNDASLQKVNGAELATGFHVKGPGGDNSLLDSFDEGFGNEKQKANNKPEKKDPNMFALAALLFGAAGLLLSLLNNRKAGGVGALLTGTVAGLALIGLMIDIKDDLGKESMGKDPNISISVEFTAWFYLTVVLFLLAAFFGYKRMKEGK